MYDETNCIYYENENKCKIAEEDPELNWCGCCLSKQLLLEGEELQVVEKYTLKRVNGKVIKVNDF